MPIVIRSSELRPYTYSDVNGDYLYNNYDMVVYDIDAINGQILQIFSTLPGERPFEPTFGSNITNFLYDPQDNITAYKIRVEILVALQKWMPRVEVDMSKTRVDPLPDGLRGYTATIAYKVVQLGVAASLQLNLSGAF